MQFKDDHDPEKLAVLYDRYLEMIYAVCLKYLEDDENARDAVMDIYESLSVKVIRHEIDNFKGWLYTVVKNHCLMQLRKTAGRKIVSIDEEFMQSQQQLHQDDVHFNEWQLNNLSGCIETLSADQKKIVDLFYLQQKCYKEIVEQTGFDWNKVRSLVQNGRRNLKICMESKARYEQQ